MKEKKLLMNEISSLISERTEKSKSLNQIVTEAGYRSVDSFMKAFKKSKALVEEYLKITESGEVSLQ